jgi:polar amino acid transport system substrate-binding protein
MVVSENVRRRRLWERLVKRVLGGLVSLMCALIVAVASASFAAERILILAAPADIPPYYTEDGGGIIPDIMRAALGPSGYTIKVRPMGNMRMAVSIRKGKIDIAPYAVIDIPNMFNSVRYLSFLNVAVTKKSKNIRINAIDDLKGLKVSAFQGAKSVFGDHYTHVVETDASLYKELSDQKKQMTVFWNDRVDTVILGKLIFDYRSFYVKGATHNPDSVSYHRIFGKGTDFSAVFNDKEIRDAFDNGFQRLKASKDLDAIYGRYVR